MKVELRPIKVIRSTKMAYRLEWFDYNHQSKVQAWVPKSLVKIEHYMAYLDQNIYNNLKITKV